MRPVDSHVFIPTFRSDIPNDALHKDINDHYQNPEYNEFEEGIPVAECDQNCQILLKNMPNGLTKTAIRENILRHYGEVTKMNIPESLVHNGGLWVFATFKKFA